VENNGRDIGHSVIYTWKCDSEAFFMQRIRKARIT